ncbi:HotDog domain-containing protein [Hypoxylon fuscum]|nr:HotDog domain-containing protein [Hypoxylon fuscum]
MLVGPRAAAQLCRRTALASLLPPRSNPTIPICRGASAISSPSLLHSTRLFSISRRCAADPSKDQEAVAVAAVMGQPGVDTNTDAPPKSPPRQRGRGLFYSATFLLVGLSLGTLVRFTLVPEPLPEPGSPADTYMQSRIRADGAALPLVQQLSHDPAWISWDAYSGLQSTQTAQMVQSRITSGPLSGSAGLPFQRVFHNPRTGEVVSVVYFGSATTGWPGVVHGGAIATVLDETLGRCAILRFPARTGVTARLELTYKAPTIATRYYIIRTRPLVKEGEDPAKSDRKMWVEGTLETAEGRVCVEAKALFVVPKGVKLKPLVEGF